MNDQNEKKGNDKEQECHGPQGCIEFAAVHSAAHIGGERRRQIVRRVKQALRECAHLPDDHGNSECFAKSSGQAEYDSGQDARHRSGEKHFINHLPASRAKTIGTFDILLIHAADGICGDGSDRRIDHDGKHDRCRQHRLSVSGQIPSG